MTPIPRRGRLGQSPEGGRKRTANPVVVGAIGIVVMLIVVYFAFAKRVPLLHGYQLEGVFSSSNQVRKGSPVRVAGVDVGKVVGFEKGPGTTRIVKMEIKDTALPIHKDATLRIRPRIFLEGGFYVELQPGSPSAPELDSGGTVPLSQTSIPVQIHQVFNAFNRPVRDDLRQMLFQLDETLDHGGAEALRRLPEPLAPALRDLAIINESARGIDRHDLSDLVLGLSRVTGGLARRDDELAALVTNLNRTTRAFASESGGLRGTLRELAGVLEAAPPTLSALDRALPPTTQLFSALRPSLRIAPPVLRRANDVVREFRAWSRPQELPRLVSNLKPALQRLPTLNSRLTVLFPTVTPVTDCLDTRVGPVLYSKLDDGKLSSGRPVWQELAHAFVGLASASQNFDGNGPAVRLQVAGTNTLLGARPRWLGPGVKPPFRPDQPCREQPAPDLQARTSGTGPVALPTLAGRATPGPRLAQRDRQRLLRAIEAAGKGRR